MRRNNNKNIVVAVAATAVLLVLAAMFGGILPVFLGGGGGNSLRSADFTTTSSGLQYKTTKQGLGLAPTKGQTVEAHYTGWLQGFNKGKAFDSSRKGPATKPFRFQVGTGQVIQGWDESFATMRVGERRQLIIPSKLGYGSSGAGSIIPGGATLYFDVELVSIRK